MKITVTRGDFSRTFSGTEDQVAVLVSAFVEEVKRTPAENPRHVPVERRQHVDEERHRRRLDSPFR